MPRVAWTKRARKQLARLDAITQARIKSAVALLAVDGVGDVKPLVGQPGYRLRVGDWRVVFDVDADGIVMLVMRVRPRGDAYK